MVPSPSQKPFSHTLASQASSLDSIHPLKPQDSVSPQQCQRETELFLQAASLGFSSIVEADPSAKWIVGVSGGRDSVALLHYLSHIVRSHPLLVAHLNHGLRADEADADADFVAELCQLWGLPLESQKCDVASIAQQRSCSIETAGRHARHEFFLELCRKHDTSFVVLAHHLDDQHETVLSNLLRGSSSKGLMGMQPVHRMENGLIKLRPLLQVRRSWISSYLETHQVPFREDSSNAVADVRRNRLRLKAIPLLNDIFQRDTCHTLSRLSQSVALDEDYFNQEVHRWFESPTFFDPQKPLEIRITEEFKLLHSAIRRRILHRWLKDYVKLSEIDSKLIESAESMISGSSKINLPGGLFLRRKSKRFFVDGINA